LEEDPEQIQWEAGACIAVVRVCNEKRQMEWEDQQWKEEEELRRWVEEEEQNQEEEEDQNRKRGKGCLQGTTCGNSQNSVKGE